MISYFHINRVLARLAHSARPFPHRPAFLILYSPLSIQAPQVILISQTLKPHTSVTFNYPKSSKHASQVYSSKSLSHYLCRHTTNTAQKPKTADQPAAAPAAPAKPTRKPKVPDAEANHKKPKEAKTLKILEHDSATPIDVTYEGDSIHAKATKNGDTYIHTLKLTSPCAFALVRTVSSTFLPPSHTTQHRSALSPCH